MTWSYSDGVLTISGSGDMPDYTEYYFDYGRNSGNVPGQQHAPWNDYYNSYRSQATAIVIDPGITSIGAHAFDSVYDSQVEDGLTSFSIPESVTCIGDYAFGTCVKLESPILPNSLTGISESAFSDTGFDRAVIPEGVTDIGST